MLRGVCSKFCSFSYPEPAMEGSKSKIQREGLEWSVWIQDIRFVFSPRFLLHSPASSCKSFQRHSLHPPLVPMAETSATKLSYQSRNSTARLAHEDHGPCNPNVLRRDHKRACNDLARANALLGSFEGKLACFFEYLNRLSL